MPMIIFKELQGLENLCIKFQDFPYLSRICTYPDMSLFETQCGEVDSGHVSRMQHNLSVIYNLQVCSSCCKQYKL